METEFMILMNPMTENAEWADNVGIFPTREEAIQFIEAEKVEPYQDGQYHKVFKKDGALEWYNPLSEEEKQGKGHFEQGIIEVRKVMVERYERV